MTCEVGRLARLGSSRSTDEGTVVGSRTDRHSRAKVEEKGLKMGNTWQVPWPRYLFVACRVARTSNCGAEPDSRWPDPCAPEGWEEGCQKRCGAGRVDLDDWRRVESKGGLGLGLGKERNQVEVTGSGGV